MGWKFQILLMSEKPVVNAERFVSAIQQDFQEDAQEQGLNQQRHIPHRHQGQTICYCNRANKKHILKDKDPCEKIMFNDNTLPFKP
jgi:hypothetical protein